MKIVKKTWGTTLYGLGKLMGGIFDGLIGLITFITNIVISVGKGALALISMGGCLFIMILGPTLLFNPKSFLAIVFLIGFPIIGMKSITYLKYKRYMVTEYLFDRADNYRLGKQAQFSTFNEYGNKYWKMEEERLNRERQKRQEEEQRMWEERFRQWGEYERSQRGNYQYYTWSNQGSGYNNQAYVNPNIEFKSKYEKSCDLLGLPYNADKYEVKLNFRKKAKEYHPDVNKSPNATEMFQKINDAYEFLSDSNIERYKNMN